MKCFSAPILNFRLIFSLSVSGTRVTKCFNEFCLCKRSANFDFQLIFSFAVSGHLTKARTFIHLSRKAWKKVYAIFFMYQIVRQNQFDKLCNTERGWAFERVINGALDGYDHKSKDGVESRNECAR